LKLKAKFESGSSYFSFKRTAPGAFNAGSHRVNLHRPTKMTAGAPAEEVAVTPEAAAVTPEA